MYKAKYKTKYKNLVRQGSLKEAEKVLNKLRFFSREGILPNSPENNVEEPKEDKTKYNKTELEKLSFSDLREIGYELGAKGRSKTGLIKDILAIQKGEKEPEIT